MANQSIGAQFQFDRGFDKYKSVSPNKRSWSEFVDSDKRRIHRYVDFGINVLRSDARSVAVFRDAIVDKFDWMFDIDTQDQLDIDESDDGARKILETLESTSFGNSEFVFLNLMEAHSPFNPPNEYLTGPPARFNSAFRATFLDGPDHDDETIKRAYGDSVRYLSDSYQQIHEVLERDFEYIITISDHGEALGEWGNWGHTCILDPKILNIPVAISCTNDVQPTDRPINLVDIYQTVCSLAGIDPGVDTHGVSLTTTPSQPRFTESHGLVDLVEERLDEDGFDADFRAIYDTPLVGVATTDGYAYETPHNKLRNPANVEAADELIKKFDETIPVVDYGDTREIEGRVKDRLKDLGYA